MSTAMEITARIDATAIPSLVQKSCARPRRRPGARTPRCVQRMPRCAPSAGVRALVVRAARAPRGLDRSIRSSRGLPRTRARGARSGRGVVLPLHGDFVLGSRKISSGPHRADYLELRTFLDPPRHPRRRAPRHAPGRGVEQTDADTELGPPAGRRPRCGFRRSVDPRFHYMAALLRPWPRTNEVLLGALLARLPRSSHFTVRAASAQPGGVPREGCWSVGWLAVRPQPEVVERARPSAHGALRAEGGSCALVRELAWRLQPPIQARPALDQHGYVPRPPVQSHPAVVVPDLQKTSTPVGMRGGHATGKPLENGHRNHHDGCDPKRALGPCGRTSRSLSDECGSQRHWQRIRREAHSSHIVIWPRVRTNAVPLPMLHLKHNLPDLSSLNQTNFLGLALAQSWGRDAPGLIPSTASC